MQPYIVLNKSKMWSKSNKTSGVWYNIGPSRRCRLSGFHNEENPEQSVRVSDEEDQRGANFSGSGRGEHQVE